MPPSEANVTMNVASFSEYTALASETNVTMADVLKNVAQDLASEHTAKSAHPTFDTTAYVERLQAELGIPDSKVIGLECSNFSNAKIIDSIECLHQLDKFQPIPVDFDQNPDFGKTGKSEVYLRNNIFNFSQICGKLPLAFIQCQFNPSRDLKNRNKLLNLVYKKCRIIFVVVYAFVISWFFV